VSLLSADTLFHLTPSAENLLGILTNEFRPRYCLERFQIADEIVEVAFPVVCFCDIPLSQIQSHIGTYGHYGIGLSKEWAEIKGLNPVLYVQPKAEIGKHLGVVGEAILGRDDENLAGEAAMLDLMGYIKPYAGDFIRGQRSFTNVRFYDEREWRLVVRSNASLLDKAEFLDAIRRARADQLVQDNRLSFEPKDIKYVIVDLESERLSTVRALRDIKSPKYSPEQIDILTSRIVTCQQVISDF